MMYQICAKSCLCKGKPAPGSYLMNPALGSVGRSGRGWKRNLVTFLKRPISQSISSGCLNSGAWCVVVTTGWRFLDIVSTPLLMHGRASLTAFAPLDPPHGRPLQVRHRDLRQALGGRGIPRSMAPDH